MSSLLIVYTSKRSAHSTYMQQHQACNRLPAARDCCCAVRSAASSRQLQRSAASAGARSTAQDSKIILRAFVAVRPSAARAAYNLRDRRCVSPRGACSRALCCRCCCLRCARPARLPAARCRVAACLLLLLVACAYLSCLLLSAVPRYCDTPARGCWRLYTYSRIIICTE